jgi:hypothetical protein
VAFSATSRTITTLRLALQKYPIRNASLLDRARNHMRAARRHVAHDFIPLKAPEGIGAAVLPYPITARRPAHTPPLRCTPLLAREGSL